MEDIEIPSHFLCPISLQLMRDPVTVATGITYDRESIEKWLFSCKNTTCPVTKQTLCSSGHLHLTPNHNLRRLIQSWCTLHASHGIERIPTPRAAVDGSHLIKLINDAKGSPDTQHKCLQRLKSIASSSERNKKHLETSGIVVDFLASIIMTQKEDNVGSTSTTRWSNAIEAVSILHQLELSNVALKAVMNQNEEFVDSLLHILRHGHAETRAFVISLLKNIYSIADPHKLISTKLELFMEIVQVLRDQISYGATKISLQLLIELNPWGKNRIKAVEARAVAVLVDMLLETSERRINELALYVLVQLCDCAEGRAELLNHGGGLAIVSKKIFRVSNGASDRAVKILKSIAKRSANARVLAEMLEVGVVAKLCLVLQIDCGLKTKERAKEILRLHSRAWKNSPCVPAHLLYSYPS
ncbi:hypothetical protein Ancab_011342 [Ancistrocladus abbreviatus]